MKSILVIDDDLEFYDSVETVLLDAGYDMWHATCPAEALEMLKYDTFDLILCDLLMPFNELPKESPHNAFSVEVGVRTVRELVDIFPNLPIVALSAAAPQDLIRIAQYLDPVPARTKPKAPQELISIVELAIETGPARWGVM